MRHKSSPDSRRRHAIAEAWLEAHEDLGIEVQIPFTIVSPEGSEFAVLGLIKHWGGPQGTILISMEDDFQALGHLLESLGYAWSASSPFSYGRYDRERFIELLNDWGWYGNRQEKPGWYHGQLLDRQTHS